MTNFDRVALCVMLIHGPFGSRTGELDSELLTRTAFTIGFALWWVFMNRYIERIKP